MSHNKHNKKLGRRTVIAAHNMRNSMRDAIHNMSIKDAAKTFLERMMGIGSNPTIQTKAQTPPPSKGFNVFPLKAQRTPAGWLLECGLAGTAKEAINLIRQRRVKFDGRVIFSHFKPVRRPREILIDG